MATAKTPKNIPAAAKPAVAAAKPAAPAVKAAAPAEKTAASAVKAAAPAVKTPVPPVKAAKPAPARAADAKPSQDAVVHSAEIAKKPVAKAADPVSETPLAAATPSPVVPAAVVETVTKAAETAAPAVHEAVEATAEIAKEPAAKALAVVKKATDETQDRVARSMTPLLDYSRDSAILMIATGNQLALGLHKLSLSLIDWSAESCDKGVAASQAMLSAKTVEEVVDLSRSLARDGIQQFLKESAELSSLSTRLIEDTIVPLPARLAAAAEKLAAHAA